MSKDTTDGAAGLQRDLNLIRRRAWLFIPFFLLGVVLAFAFGRVAGQSNAVASMQLETVVQDLVLGGDRGLRIFEAQSMTGDERFKEMVRAEIGDPNFDYSRFSIALAPISIADGVSRGILTVSIYDEEKVNAERYRDAFVTVFEREYTSLDGLFRERFVSKKREVAEMAEASFQSAVEELRPLAEERGLPVDELVRSRQYASAGLVQELNRQEAELQRQLGEVTAALALPGDAVAAIAPSILGQPAEEDAAAALRARQATIEGAIESVRDLRLSLSDVSPEFDAEDLMRIDYARTLAEIKNESFVRLNNAVVAVTSAQSDVETSKSFSGGVAGTSYGRVAVVITVTLVFGLVAIYLLEWLSQVRAGDARRTA